MPLDTYTDILQALAAQAAAFLALLLAGSALHKTLSWTRTRTAAERFAGIPRPAAGAAAAIAIAAEFVAAALLIAPSTRMPGALVAAALWSLYLGLIVGAIRGGRRDVDCGCSFGAPAGRGAGAPAGVGAASAAGGGALGAYHELRNAVLLALAVGVALATQRCGGIAVTASQALGACAMLALYGAVEQVSVLKPLRRGVVA